MKPKAIIVSGYFNPLHKGHLELFEEAKVLFKNVFGAVKVFKPEASRAASKEIYLIGLRFGV